MRHNYVGDEGDYAKLALLNVLRGGKKLGVNWYLTEHEEGEGQQGAGDGKKLAHLTDDDWLYLDEALLMRMRENLGDWLRDKRCIGQLEELLPGADFYSVPLPTGVVPLGRRIAAREAWHLGALSALERADIVFVDPDNGFEVASTGKRSKRRCKYATYREISGYLGRGQAVVAYQHRPRMSWPVLLGKVGADLAAKVPTAPPGFIAFGDRGFFLMHEDPREVARLTGLAMALKDVADRARGNKFAIEVLQLPA